PRVVGQDHGALPERSVRVLAAGLAQALGDIHAAGIVHRDLKPSNVLVTIDGPRVIDFGIARALETPTENGLTRTGSLVGSPGFMAPEQVRGDRVTPACDVFCLGSLLVYAATGALPFGPADSGVHAQMFRIAQEEPDLTGVPEGIAELVRACLRKDPAARPSLATILERTGAQDTVMGGRSRDPWLPAALVAQLGRHAMRLLETENPADAAQPGGGEVRDGGEDRDGGGDGNGRGGPGGQGSPEVPGVPEGTTPAQETVPVPGPQAAPGHTPAPQAAFGHTPAPEAAPEHASAADDGSAADTGAGRASAPAPAQRTDAAAPAPVQPAHGHPQHPQQHPVQHPAYGRPPYGASGPHGPYHPYGDPGIAPSYSLPPAGATVFHPPGGPQEPPPRDGRSTALLVVIALVVALAAGGSVFALMSGGGRPAAAPTTAPASAHPTAPGPSGSPASSAPASESPADGAVPEAYLGTWAATIDSAAGPNTRRLTIRQGRVGEALLTLVAEGPAGQGTYHCEFTAHLTRKPGADGPLEIGPSTVTSGEPRSSCSPGAATEVTLLPSGALERVNTSTGESLTYVRG
ncbi:protein kinase, partial [Streptomyces sp. NPDC059766]|uniref:protein kinase domain-containing protein n=1 Tax=Streptomyces sp. NPDC059766 TaxID=3346940 RepID=UPI0036517F76